MIAAGRAGRRRRRHVRRVAAAPRGCWCRSRSSCSSPRWARAWASPSGRCSTSASGRPAGAVRQGDRIAGGLLGVFGVLAVMWLLIPALASHPGGPWGRCATRWSAPPRSTGWRPNRPTRRKRWADWSATRPSPRCSTRSPHPTRANRPPAGVPADRGGARRGRGGEGGGRRVRRGAGRHRVRGRPRPRRHQRAHRATSAPGGRPTAAARHRAGRIRPAPRPRGAAGAGTRPRAARAHRREHRPARGSLFGHPGGGPLRESPIRVAEEIVADGTDVARTVPTERQVFVLAAVAAPGDSARAGRRRGGPGAGRDVRASTSADRRRPTRSPTTSWRR